MAAARMLSRNVAPLLLAAACMLPAARAHADTVASLLGNFTVNQHTTLALADDGVHVHYAVVFGQLPALRELHAADRDGDGVTTAAERDAHAQALAPTIAAALQIIVDGVPVPLQVVRQATSLPTEQGGFSLRIDTDLAGPLPAAGAAPRTLALANRNYAGQFGWNEIVVTTGPRWSAFATNAFSTSPTAGLTEALTTMPAAGPLDERSVQLRFTAGPLPAGAHALGPRPDAGAAAPPPAAAIDTSLVDAGWLQAQTRRLIDVVSAPEVTWPVALLALLAAVVLGALHAFSPGHGKTVVGAYLIGSRGTPRHALFLGVTVTITHTLGVFALGAATLFASSYVMPARVLPVLAIVSGLLVLGMGVYLLVQRWPALQAWLRRRARAAAPARAGTLAFRPLALAHGAGGGGRHVLARVNGGAHAHGNAHAHGHGAGMHSHGGVMHSHLPPGTHGDAVTWRSLLALGISGGLVPCPSALVLLLAAVALNKTGYGLLLVLAFSVGLAMTLTAVGLVFLHARNRLRTPAAGSAWIEVLPVLSAAAITLLGALLCYGAWTGVSL